MSDDFSDLAEPVAAEASSSFADIAEPVAAPAQAAAPTQEDTGDQATRALQREKRKQNEAAENAPDQVQRGVLNNRVPQTFAEGFKQAWEKEDIQSLANQNFFVRMGRIAEEKGAIRQEIMQSDEYKEKVANARTFGGKADVEQWMKGKILEVYKERRKGKTEPDVAWSEILPGMVKAATENPGKFFGDLVKGMVVDPELFAIPGLGQGKAALNTAQVAAKTAAEAALATAKASGDAAAIAAAETALKTAAAATPTTAAKVAAEAKGLAGSAGAGGAMMVPIEAARQFEEIGEVKPQATAQAAAQGVVMGGGIHVAMRPLVEVAKVGLEIAAKRKQATVTPEVLAEFEAKVKSNIESGMTPTDAVIKELEKAGWGKEEAAEIKKAVEPIIEKQPVKETSDAAETRVKQEGDSEQHQGTETGGPADAASRGDSNGERAPEGKASEEVVPPREPPDEPPPGGGTSNPPGPLTKDLPPLDFTVETPKVEAAPQLPLSTSDRALVAEAISNFKGKKGAVTPDSFKEVNVPGELRGFFDAVYKITGQRVTPIRFVDEAINARLKGFVVSPGVKDRIFVTALNDPQYPIHFLTGHEVFHTIEKKHPDLAQTFIDFLRAEKPDYEGARKRHGHNPAAEKYVKQTGRRWSMIEGEMGADYLGRRFQDPAFWKALEKKDPSLFQKVSTVVIEFLRKLLLSEEAKSSVPSKWVKETKRMHDAALDMIHEVAKRTDKEFAEKVAAEKEAWDRAQKQAKTEQQAKTEPLPDNDYYHFTREPGTRELDVSKANEGNVRGKGIYLSKTPQTSHAKPRVDRQGNLGAKTEGELLKTTVPPEVAARMFDESRMFSRDEARAILEKAGFLPDEAAAILGNKQSLSGESVYKMLKKQMGDADHASAQLKEQGYTGVKFKDKAGNDLAVVFESLKAEPAFGDVPPPLKELLPHQRAINEAEAAAAREKPGRAPPERSLKVGLGAKGQRTLEFSTPLGKELFRLASMYGKMMKASDAERASLYETARMLEERIKQQMGDLSKREILDAAKQQYDAAMDMARAMPENSIVQVPSPNFGKRGGKQGGFADPKVLAAIGLSGIGGLGIYALTGGDLYKSIGAAAALGALPFAARVAGRVTRGTANVMRELTTDTRFPTKETFRAHATNVGVGNYAVDVWRRATEALLKGEPDIKASYTRIRDYTQGFRDAPLSPREQAAANELRRFLDYMGQRGVEGKVLRNLIEDYLPGLYQKNPLSKWSDIYDLMLQKGAFRGNMTGMSPKSRHNLHKVIPDYRTVEALIADGTLKLVPLTNNPFEMAAIYGKSLNKSIANRKLIDTLARTPGPNTYDNGKPIPLLVPITTEGAARRLAQAMAIMRDKLDIPEATTDMMTRFGILTAPKDYVHVQHPALEGVRVHRDLVPGLELMFDTSNRYSVAGMTGRAAHATSMAAKSMLFSFSLFHAASLAVVGGTMMLRRPSMFMRIPGAAKAVLGKNFAPEVKSAIEAGVTLGHHINDVDPSFMQKAFNLTQKYASDLPLVGPVAGGLVAIPRAAHRWMNHFMWEMVHPTLKLAQFMTEEARFDRKNPGAPPNARAKAMRELASGVNDLYGGINWFELANNVDSHLARNLAVALFSARGRRMQQNLLLAPDWNIAATRVWYEAMKASSPGITRRASDSMYRSYLFMSALTYLGAAQFLQKKMTGENIFDKEDWSYVDMGDGRKIQLNKHFMEGVHLIQDPTKFLLNKMGYIPKETLLQLTNKEYLTTDQKGQVVGPPMEGSRVGHAASHLATPITTTTLKDPFAFAMGMFGFPVSGSTNEAKEKKAGERAAAQGKDEEKAKARVRKKAEKEEDKRRANRERRP